RCTDGKFGELADVVIDPVHKRLTHVIVRGHGDLGMARLVPFALVQADGERQISLRCSVDEACTLDPVQDFAYLRIDERPPADPKWDVASRTCLRCPPTPRAIAATTPSDLPRTSSSRMTACPRGRSR